MGVLIRLKSGEFLDKFIKEFDYKDYRFLLISDDIKSKDHKNVYPLRSLLPTTDAISEFISNGYTEKYIKRYVKYLQTPKIALLIATIVRMVVAENRKVILMCSDHENEYKYLKVLSEFIESSYGIDVYSYKKYSKDPESCENKKFKKKFIKQLDEHIEQLSEAAEADKETNKGGNIKKRLELASKSELKAYCKENSIKVKKDDSKKDIIKRIMKALGK